MPNDGGGTLSAMASDAASGFALGGPVGAGIGGLIGLFSSLGSESQQTQIDQRKQLLLQFIAARRAQALAEGTAALAKQTQAAASTAGAGAGRRAVARGAQDPSGAILPAEQGAIAAGSDAMEKFTNATNAEYDKSEMQVQMGAFNSPLKEPFSDVVAKIGQSAVGMVTDIRKQELMDRYNNNSPGGLNDPGTPSMDASGNPTYYPKGMPGTVAPDASHQQSDLQNPGAVNAASYGDALASARTTAMDGFKSNVGPGIATPGYDNRQVDSMTRDLVAAHRRMYMGLGGRS